MHDAAPQNATGVRAPGGDVTVEQVHVTCAPRVQVVGGGERSSLPTVGFIVACLAVFIVAAVLP